MRRLWGFALVMAGMVASAISTVIFPNGWRYFEFPITGVLLGLLLMADDRRVFRLAAPLCFASLIFGIFDIGGWPVVVVYGGAAFIAVMWLIQEKRRSKLNKARGDQVA